jgi:bacillithiol biosynthesis cysteine-adding enzyme BshC
MSYHVSVLSLTETPQLFNDYLNNFSETAPFFSWNPGSGLPDCINARIRNYTLRNDLVKILKIQNRKWQASAKSLENLDKLSQPDALAVVTGQQAGLYGGPLYTAYKILTAVKMCNRLKTAHPEHSFIPVFWLEAGDNDFGEVNHFQVLDIANQLVRLELPLPPDDHRSVYRRTVSSRINDIHKKLQEIFPPNDFRDQVLNRLKNIYHEGENFAEAFARWVHAFFGEFGVVVINPSDPDIARLAKPIFHEALKGWTDILNAFTVVNRKLSDKGFHNQIQLDKKQTLLFFEDDQGSRSRIDGNKNSFFVKSASAPQKYSRDDLMNIVEKEPYRFTPNVALRPVLQDWLLPTVVYVGGPSEISYAAQLKPVYDFLGVEEPVFRPRIRISMIEKKINKVVEKLQLNYQDIFQKRENLVREHVHAQSDKLLASVFEDTRQQLSRSMKKIAGQLRELDPTLQGTVDKTTDHLQETVRKLREKADEAMKHKMETEVNQIEKVLNNLFPQGIFQERILNLIQYQVKYGPQFLRELYNSVDVEQNQHQLVFL